MRKSISLLLLGLCVSTMAAATPAPSDTPATQAPTGDLPPGPGHDLIERACSSCHSATIVTHQRLDREGWTDLVYQMADRGALVSDAELEQIIEYLAQSFPPEPTG